MKLSSNATPNWWTTLSSKNEGIFWGSVAVVCFSLSFPATKVAIGSLSGLFVGTGRALIGAALAAALLLYQGKALPRRYWARISIVALGIVIFFPLLSVYSVHATGSAHTAIMVSCLPTVTAMVGVARGGERPRADFWIPADMGVLAVVAFTLLQGTGTFSSTDMITLIAIIFGAVGYAEGGALARELGATQVISWALVFALPVITPLAIYSIVLSPPQASLQNWAALAYLGIVSMYLAFLAWYRGMALGGVARISQLQLAQPLLTLAWSLLFLGETVGFAGLFTAFFVLTSIFFSQRARIKVPPSHSHTPQS